VSWDASWALLAPLGIGLLFEEAQQGRGQLPGHGVLADLFGPAGSRRRGWRAQELVFTSAEVLSRVEEFGDLFGELADTRTPLPVGTASKH
jgi:hypothetical protein